ncbi:MAG: PfkB family carbohydrate kinase [Candidatus Margulisiibacteriota bacterium]
MTQSKKAINIIGTVAFDSIETPKGKFPRIIGGSGTFASLAASIFSKVNLISIIGKDFPDAMISDFNARGINTDGVQRIPDGNTFHWHGYYLDDMNQAFTKETELNILTQFNPILPEAAQNAEITFLANIDPELQKKVIHQLKNPKLIILDTMNLWLEHKLNEVKEVLKSVNIFMVNFEEIKLLTGLTNVVHAAEEVAKLGPKVVIVKKGEHGAIMFSQGKYFAMPAFPLAEVEDPTGAGDTFAGSFTGFLSEAETITEDVLRTALIVGTITSSYTVQGMGIEKIKSITKKDLSARIRDYRKITNLPQLEI